MVYDADRTGWFTGKATGTAVSIQAVTYGYPAVRGKVPSQVLFYLFSGFPLAQAESPAYP